MLKYFSVLLTLIILSSTSKAAFDDNYVRGQIIVMLKHGADKTALNTRFSNVGMRVKEPLVEWMNIWLMEFDAFAYSDVMVLNEVKKSPEVVLAQFNHYVSQRENNILIMPNDPSFGQQWNMHNTGQSGGTPDADIDAPEAWDNTSANGITALGDSIVVAVVDGGFYLSHPDLKFWQNWRDIPGNSIDDDTNGYVDDTFGWNAYSNNGNISGNTHGSHVSGIAAALGNNGLGVAGVNWNVKVMGVMGSSGTESVVVSAYGYVLKQRKIYNLTNGAKGAFVVSTNASFGVDYGQPSNYPLWCAFYDSLGAAGILNACATANINLNVDVQGDIPTACPSPWMVSVTNTTNTDAKNSGAAYGLTTIDLGAPGTNILSTTTSGSYGSLTGTSMATPHVAGAIAFLYDVAPSFFISQYKLDLDSMSIVLRNKMFAGVDTIPALSGITVTGGRLNLFKAANLIVNMGPSIIHSPLPNTENTAGPYIVNCVITSAGSPLLPQFTKLHWSRNNTAITDSVALTNTSGNNWTANIPGNNTVATYRYYLRTIDQLGRVAVSPGGAPANLHLFLAGPDAVKPIITHTPLGDLPKPNFPPTIAAVVVDPSDYGGLDSVWVRWYKNTTANGVQHVKLTNTGGNNFSALLNQPNSYVNYNDSIFYRIIAQDNSSSHNRDSTALYKFKIVSTVTACIGTGTTGVAWPYNTFWHDSRTQMLYTAAEITAAGGAAGNIFQVGFNVLSAASQSMNGFNIRMQNTSASSITGWVTTGWTTVYTGTYTVPGTGMQYITLQGSGFNYNGTSNLLVEICFDNTSYTSATNVASTAATNMAREYHTDGSAGCTMTSGSSVSRPNACFKINTIVGIPNVNLELPKVYSLAQNYPNPFNPTTTISYSIPKANDVVLTVYDITGKEVAKLVNEFRQAGTHTVMFDASDLASGMYMYRIESGDFIEVKKMVLIK